MLRILHICLPVVLLAFLTTSALAQQGEIQVGDSVRVKGRQAELMRGPQVLSTINSGVELKVLVVRGVWVGTAYKVDEELVGGWIIRTQLEIVEPPVEAPPVEVVEEQPAPTDEQPVEAPPVEANNSPPEAEKSEEDSAANKPVD